MRCRALACDRQIEARGMCRKHYRQYLKDRASPCKVDGCEKPSTSRGYCSMHAKRLREYGTVEGRGARTGQKHNRFKHGLTGTPTYRAWSGMKRRCYVKHDPNYENYGGRGIIVCDRWRNSFETFLADMGECPPGMSIDRIDVDGNYEPSNCRWADRKTQNRNRRFARLTDEKVEAIRLEREAGLTLADLSQRHGISVSHVHRVVTGEVWA